MATSKTLQPTNVTISIPAFGDAPDQRVNSNCIDKEADAINWLYDRVKSVTLPSVTITDGTPSSEASIDLDMTDYIPSGYAMWAAEVSVRYSEGGTDNDYHLPYFQPGSQNQVLRIQRYKGKHIYLLNGTSGWGTRPIFVTMFLQRGS